MPGQSRTNEAFILKIAFLRLILSGWNALPALLILLLILFFLGAELSCQAENQLAAPLLQKEPDSEHKKALTLSAAIDLARRNYPSLSVAQARLRAARGFVRKENTLYLPSGNLLVAESRATSNNITGPLFPQSVIPTISGSARGGTDLTGGWGCAAGALISWEPFDFGFRKSRVAAARSLAQEASARVSLTELEVQSKAADAFLSVLAAQEIVKAARSRLERMNVFAETVHALVSKDLRPATDEYLAQAHLARAKDQLIESEQNQELCTAVLAESLGIADDSLTVDPGGLLAATPSITIPERDPFSHPAALLQEAVIATARDRKRVIERSYFPRFSLMGATSGRGSSFATDVSINESKGFYPSKFNYSVGLQMTFPFLDIFGLRAEKEMESANEEAERARFQQIILDLSCLTAKARALTKGAIRTAQNAPIKVRAAQEAANSARIRYRFGLTGANEVAENEELLTLSQSEYATAQLRVWRALLAASVARGDIRKFVDEASRLSGTGR